MEFSYEDCSFRPHRFRWGSYEYPMKNCRRTAKFFPTWGLSQRYCQGLKWLDVIVLQRNAMLWDILCSKNSNVIPGISVFIGHASRPPKRIKIQLNATKCWLNIILIHVYLTLIINFNYSLPFSIIHNTTNWKELFSLKGTDWWIKLVVWHL